MSNEVVFNRYAVALVELAKEQNKEVEYRKEVKIIKNILKDNRDFSFALTDVNKDLNDKFNLIDKVFNSCKEDIKTFMKVIVQNGRAFYLYEIFKETLYRFDDALNIEEGTIYITKDMKEDEIEKVKKAIEKKTGYTLELDVVNDDSLLGGFVVKIKDNVYDASVKTKLKNLKSSLLDEGR